MTTSRVFIKKAAWPLIALPMAFAPLTGALADQSDSQPNATESSGAVETLKSSLRGASGFEVENVVMTGDGVACIRYSVNNETGGETHARAVVQGDKVLRSSLGNTRFQEEWNSKCAGSGEEAS